jgi:hypothetical protein
VQGGGPWSTWVQGGALVNMGARGGGAKNKTYLTFKCLSIQSLLLVLY